MTATLIDLEPRIRQILLRASSHIQATMAALYLSRAGQPYELVAEYGFPIPPRRQVSGSDVMVDRLITRRTAFFINGATTDQRFYELLYHWASDSIMVMPIYARGQLIGFIDLRDKADKQPFGAADVNDAKEIVAEIVKVLEEGGIVGAEGELATLPKSAEATDAQSPLSKIIERAHMTVERNLVQTPVRQKTLSEFEILPVVPLLATILNVRGAVLAGFTAYGHHGNVQQLAARSRLTDQTLAAFEEKLSIWRRKQSLGEASGETRTNVTYPFGETNAPPVHPGQLVSVLSAPVKVAGVGGLVLTIAFEMAPDRPTKQALEAYLAIIQQTIEHAISHVAMRSVRQKVAEKLIEPDFLRYPELADHCRRVSDLAEQFAQYLGMTPGEVEVVRLSAFVHDVGARLIDYGRLYRKPNYNDDDMQLMRQHTIVGAALVSESPLGDEIARIVLTHHERADGKGYPHGISGEQIPVPARIIHIIDAFDSMTSLHSYQPPIPETTAITQIRRSAGSDFDVEIGNRFCDMLTRATAFGFE